MKLPPYHSTLASVLTLTGLLAGCGSDRDGVVPPAAGAPASAVPVSTVPVPAMTRSCAELSSFAVPATSIGLPTNGAVVTSSETIASSGTGATSVGQYCLVSGSIRPIDPNAPEIRFRVALPRDWNTKLMMFGGGGFNGTIPNVTGNFSNAAPDSLSPLARGYAVFASDSGHQSAIGSSDGSFAVNDEALLNWTGDALKKTRDASVAVVQAAYGRASTRAYFLGSSTGGKEALTVAGRWPQDWNGLVSLYPARNGAATVLGLLATARALAAPGAFTSLAERSVLYRAAVAACDGLDGVRDGVISNVRGCNATFDPAIAELDGAPVRCPGGGDTGDTCLSDVQIAAIRRIDAPTPYNVPLASGDRAFPGYESLTSESGALGPSPLQPIVAALSYGFVPPGFPTTPANAAGAGFADNYFRFFVTRDNSFNYLTVDPSNVGSLGPRLTTLSQLDVGDTDLSAFAARGGKVLLMHGTADLLISIRGTREYYERLRSRLGESTLNGFLRYYEVPAFGHGISTVFNVGWDQLTALESWVERGQDPATNQTVVDTVGVPGRTRPLCLFPGWPRYRGTGDVNAAASYTCATS